MRHSKQQETLLIKEHEKKGSLPDHPLEEHSMNTLRTPLPSKPSMLQIARWIIEVYINNFIGMAQNLSRTLLRHIAKAILIFIHKFLCLPTSQVTKEGIQRSMVQREGYFVM